MDSRLCDWCQNPVARRLPKVGLCEPCNRWRKAADAAKKALGRETADGGADPLGNNFQLWVDLKLPELAKREGFRFGPSALEDPMPGLDLEHELTFIAEAATGKPMYYGEASVIEQDLSLDEQRTVLRLLAPLGRAIFRKQARGIAAGNWRASTNPRTDDSFFPMRKPPS